MSKTRIIYDELREPLFVIPYDWCSPKALLKKQGATGVVVIPGGSDCFIVRTVSKSYGLALVLVSGASALLRCEDVAAYPLGRRLGETQ